MCSRHRSRPGEMFPSGSCMLRDFWRSRTSAATSLLTQSTYSSRMSAGCVVSKLRYSTRAPPQMHWQLPQGALSEGGAGPWFAGSRFSGSASCSCEYSRGECGWLQQSQAATGRAKHALPQRSLTEEQNPKPHQKGQPRTSTPSRIWSDLNPIPISFPETHKIPLWIVRSASWLGNLEYL